MGAQQQAEGGGVSEPRQRPPRQQQQQQPMSFGAPAPQMASQKRSRLSGVCSRQGVSRSASVGGRRGEMGRCRACGNPTTPGWEMRLLSCAGVGERLSRPFWLRFVRVGVDRTHASPPPTADQGCGGVVGWIAAADAVGVGVGSVFSLPTEASQFRRRPDFAECPAFGEVVETSHLHLFAREAKHDKCFLRRGCTTSPAFSHSVGGKPCEGFPTHTVRLLAALLCRF